jgi:hypothetical protein
MYINNNVSIVYDRASSLKRQCFKLTLGEVEEDEMGGPCSTNGEKRNAYRLLVGKPEGKRSVGRPRRRWLDSIPDATRFPEMWIWNGVHSAS